MKELFTMVHVNQASNGNTENKFIEEIETTLATNDSVSIFVRAWIPDKPQRILVCVQGLGGHGGYYEELACQEALKGTLVVAPDLRGHGCSEGSRGDIDGFERYLVDIDAAVTWASTTWPGTPIFVLGESMGASIAIQYAVTGREELGCRDPAFNALLRADPLFVRLVSVRFLIQLTVWLRQSKRKAHQINLPLLVLLGGRDYVARRSGTSAFLRHVPAGEQRIVTFPQAYHCLLRDPDTPAVVKVLASWLAEHSRP